MKHTYLLKYMIGLLLITTFSLSSCSDDDEKNMLNPPKIILQQEDKVYATKINVPLTIEPQYEYAENAIFAWKIDGKLVSSDDAFQYESPKPIEIFVTLDVINEAGAAYEEFKISVRDLLPPSVSLSFPEEGYKIIQKSDLSFKPEVEDILENAEYEWYVNEEKVSDKLEYTFNKDEKGNYTLRFVAKNEDGLDEVSIPIQVCSPDELPFNWEFEREEFNVSTGRNIRIDIRNIQNDFGAEYTWAINGKEKQKGKEASFVFNEKEEGDYTLLVSMKNNYISLSKEIVVHVCPKEGTFQRKPNASSSEKVYKVYEFLPAPGQFVNENYIANTMPEANAYAKERMEKNGYVSLGGFGGYVVVGFDHSIENDNDYNIQVIGNSFDGSSEPGIIWVMQDENGDGLPNDTWYELKGSEYGKPETIQDYAVTYYRPKAPGMPVLWTDNQGQSGSVDYLKQFHKQDFYYPNWVEEDSYTLYGTCLKSRTKETSPGYWHNGNFDWGYADNFSPIDRLTGDDNYNAAPNGNHVKISDAVTHDGKPANLKYIDFVKVQTGVNAKAGWLGENSTEVFQVKDFNLFKHNTKRK